MTWFRTLKALPTVAVLLLGSLIFLLDSSVVAAALLAVSVAVAGVVQRLQPGAGWRRLVTLISALTLAGVALVVFPLNGTLLPLFLGIAGWLKLAERAGARDRFVAMIAGVWLVALGLLKLPPDFALLVIALTVACVIWALARDIPLPGAGRFGWIATALPAMILAALLFIFTPRITGDLNILAFALDLPFIIETEAESARKPPSKDMALEEFQQQQADMRVLVADFSTATGPFDKSAPPVNELYWRGPVFWTYETGRWKVRPGFDRRGPRMASKLTGETLEAQMRDATRISMYDVTVFPHRGEWLYSLDIPAFSPPSTYITRDWQLMNLNPVRSLLSYKMMSYVEYRAGAEPDEETRTLGLQLPTGEEPRTIALGRRLAQKYGPDPVAIARAGRAYFAQGFTLDRRAEPSVGANQIDRFVFEEREGFGMHFATAYALMMRAAGIPARVVSGYHGGLHMFLIERVYVTEHDSHAWVEIWLDEYGWVRMDVARATLAEQAADGLQPAPAPEQPETQEQEQEPAPEAEEKGHWLSKFDAQMQSRLLESSGLNANAGVLALSGVGVTVVLALLYAFLHMVRRVIRRRAQPAATQLIQIFCRDLARKGAHRRSDRRCSDEGLRSYVARVLMGLSLSRDEEAEINRATEWLCTAQYGIHSGPAPVGVTRLTRAPRLVRQIASNNQ